VLSVEQEDFMENPPKKFYRLAPGKEVRLRYGYFIKCVNVMKDPKTGRVAEVHCTYDPETRSGFAPDGRKVDATIHWISEVHSLPAEVRLYDRLFRVANPLGEKEDFTKYLNSRSLETLKTSRVEPSLGEAAPSARFQFERLGYFCVDPVDSSAGHLVFNRIVTLRDTWAKVASQGKKK
jgi:glutaminyl-tRNA synthetase